MRHDRASAFGNDRRVRHLCLVAHRLQVVDDVVGVFLQRVVDARFEIGLRAVVIDAEPAADVHVFQARARLDELHVNARRLVERPLDDTDVGNLAAEMEVEQLQAVFHSPRLQLVEPLQNFGDREPELRAVSAG